ncbi:MAG TPA: RRXRR domain-containing protein [Ktedonobacteraceae bacterium]
MNHMFVPVVDREQRPLMPTTPARARRWIKTAKATAFWKGGLFCVRLNIEPSAREHQRIAVGIDPGSKKEALVVASAAHTYLNIQANARTGVKEAKKQSSQMRRTRRGRNTPCRKPRQNRKHSKKKVPPSTKARWQWKLRLASWLCQLFPVSVFAVEDVKAPTHQGKRRWNRDFSPLQVGKYWFYEELGKLAPVRSMQGFQTKELRVELGLKKTSNKMAEVWQAHCVDAWVLAHAAIGGCKTPDNTRLVCIAPLIWHRRQLHKLQPAKGGKRRREGGTLSLGIKRGTLVKHPTWGKAYVGGTMNGKLSLHAPRPGKRITQSADVPDCTLIKLLRWRTRIVLYKKVPVSSALKEGTPVFSPVGTGHPQAHIGEIHGDARP